MPVQGRLLSSNGRSVITNPKLNYMKRLTYILVFIVLASCSGSIPAVWRDTFDSAERLMQNRPDSALDLICSIDTAGFTRPARARYALLLSQALDKNYIDLESDSVIRPAVEYYSRRGNATDRARTYYYLARIHTNAGDLESAIRAYVSAEHYANRCDDYNLRGLLYANMGKLYYDQYNLDNALQMYGRSIEAYRHTDNLRNLEQSLYAKAKTHYLYAQYAEAFDFYHQAMDIAVRRNDSLEISNINIGIAATFLHDPATPDLDTVIRIVNAVYGQRPYQQKDWALVCYYYFKSGQLDSARRYADMIIEHLDSYTGWKAAGVYLLLDSIRNYVKDNGIKHYQMIDSLQTNVVNQFLGQIDADYKIEANVRQYQHDNNIKKLCIYCLSVIAIICIGFLCKTIIINKKNNIIQKRELSIALQCMEELKANYIILQNQHNILSSKINTYDVNTRLLINTLKCKIECLQDLIEAANISKTNPVAFVDKFKQFIKSEYDKSALDNLCTITNLCGYGIVDYLYKNYPKLSKSEMQLCCLMCFGFSTPSIRFILDHNNIDSIYTIRFRVRTKLGLNRSENLERFLHSLIDKLSNDSL